MMLLIKYHSNKMDVRLRPLACWDRRFKSRSMYGCLFLLKLCNVQVHDSATDRFLVQGRPTERMSFSVINCNNTYNE
jgi:hypothetical protein